MNTTLEREFSEFKIVHMFAVLKAKMIMYYQVVLADTVQLPPFMGGDTPEKCADRAVRELFERDVNEFVNMYEKAYQELAQMGEI